MSEIRGGLVVAGLVLVCCTAGLASAAGPTDVTVEPTDSTVYVDETVTVDVVVDAADGGVGSVDLAVTVGDGTVANVTNVTVAGNPEMVDAGGNDTHRRIVANGMDTDDNGSVTVASLTIRGNQTGSTDLDLAVTAVGDERGVSYDVEGVTDGTVSVRTRPTGGDSGGNVGSGGGSLGITDTETETTPATDDGESGSTGNATDTETDPGTDQEGGLEGTETPDQQDGTGGPSGLLVFVAVAILLLLGVGVYVRYVE